MSNPIFNTLKVNASNEVINTIYEEINKRLSLVWLDSEKQTIQFETNFEPECEMVAEFAARFPEAKLMYYYGIIQDSDLYSGDVEFDGSEIYEGGKLIERTIELSQEEESFIRENWEAEYEENDIEDVIASLKAMESHEAM